MNSNLLLLLGAAFSVSGVLLLRTAWRARRAGFTTQRRRLVLAAWALTAIAFIPWTMAKGIDKGAAFAILVFMFAGFALVLRAGFAHEGNGRRATEREARVNGSAETNGMLLRRFGVFLLAGPVAGAAAIFLAAAMFAAWDVATGSTANRLAAVMLFVPFAWALLAMIATYDVKLKYRALFVCAFLFAGLAGTFLPEMI